MEDGHITQVGRTGDELRLWVAHECVRQTEAMMKQQHEMMSGMEARAIAVIGWVATIGSAIGGGVAAGAVQPAIMIALVPLSGAAAAALMVVWPKPWDAPGTTFDDTRLWAAENDLTMELQYAEGAALGLQAAHRKNKQSALKAARWLRAAWCCLAVTPLVIAAVSAFRWVHL